MVEWKMTPERLKQARVMHAGCYIMDALDDLDAAHAEIDRLTRAATPVGRTVYVISYMVIEKAVVSKANAKRVWFEKPTPSGIVGAKNGWWFNTCAEAEEYLTRVRMRDALEWMAGFDDQALSLAKTLHWDMRDKARNALREPEKP